MAGAGKSTFRHLYNAIIQKRVLDDELLDKTVSQGVKNIQTKLVLKFEHMFDSIESEYKSNTFYFT